VTPLTAAGGRLLTAMDENGPDHLLARGMPCGDVENLLRGLWLVMVELMHQGSAVCAGLEHRNDVGIVDLWEFMTLLGETPDVVPLGFNLLPLATLQIPRILGPHVCALKVAGKDILEIFPTIDRVSKQVIELGFGHVIQVNGEELNDRKVIVRPTHPTCKSVVLQPNTGISFAIVFGDVAGRPEMFREACITHVAPERFGPQPVGAKTAPFPITAPTMM
jgi:hypothetical protein